MIMSLTCQCQSLSGDNVNLSHVTMSMSLAQGGDELPIARHTQGWEDQCENLRSISPLLVKDGI